MFKLTQKAAGILMSVSLAVILYEIVITLWFLVFDKTSFIVMSDMQTAIFGGIVLICVSIGVLIWGRKKENGDE